ncbi:lysine exporter protein LysE/YggA, partial [Acidovorax delafieldii 2AN]
AQEAAPAQGGAGGPGLGRMVGRGMVMNLTNPKVLVFFLAFLPQFADPARGSVAVQLMLLGVVFMLATLLVFGAIACFSGGFGALLQRSARAQTVLNRVAGLVFLGLAVRLATAER